MTLLIATCAAFVFVHLGISGTPLRDLLRNSMGAGPYLGVYSLLAFASLGGMIYAYSQVPHTDFIWLPSETAYKVTKVLLLLAVVSIVMGTLTPNPTAVGMEGSVSSGPAGIVRITRHPTQWGITLFAIGHLIANGDVASIIFFGTFLLVSFYGMFSMDRRKRAQGEEWEEFFASTSMVPFAAIFGGRTQLSLGDINWAVLIAGVALYGCIYWLHDLVSGGASLF